MIRGIDHVVILADDLTMAMRRYAALGFAVEPGGSHPAWGTENALVPLSDGTYLELLAVRDPRLASGHRFWQRPDGGMREPGAYGAYALISDDLAADVALIRSRGLTFTDPQEGSRRRPDGRIVKWRLAYAQQPELPFLIEDETPHDLRVAPPDHGIGSDIALDEVIIEIPSLDDAAHAHAQLLGLPGARGNGGRWSGAPHLQFTTLRGRVALVQSPPGGRVAQRTPQTFQEPGVVAINLAVRRWTEYARALRPSLREEEGGLHQVDPAATGGVRLSLRPA